MLPLNDAAKMSNPRKSRTENILQVGAQAKCTCQSYTLWPWVLFGSESLLIYNASCYKPGLDKMEWIRLTGV